MSVCERKGEKYRKCGREREIQRQIEKKRKKKKIGSATDVQLNDKN